MIWLDCVGDDEDDDDDDEDDDDDDDDDDLDDGEDDNHDISYMNIRTGWMRILLALQD